MIKSNTAELTSALEELRTCLDRVPSLNLQIADYVFFPVSYVFQAGTSLPSKVLALSFRCLELIIRKGWGEEADRNLVKQLLILLTVRLYQAVKQSEDHEQAYQVLKCLSTLFNRMPNAISLLDISSGGEDIALIGQLTDSLLMIISAEPVLELQLEALTTLYNFLSIIGDVELLMRFFPGIVSRLTRSLEPSTQHRRHSSFLAEALNCLSILFQKLKDAAVENSNKKLQPQANGDSTSWLQANSSKILLALNKTSKLQNHEKPRVQQALIRWCMVFVQQYSSVLQDCLPLALQTTICVCTTNNEEHLAIQAALEQILVTNTMTASAVSRLCENWITSLPDTLRSTDTKLFTRQLAHISFACSILHSAHADLTSVQQALPESLNASLKCLFRVEPSPRISLAHLDEKSIIPSLTLPNSELRDANGLLSDVDQAGQLDDQALLALSAFIRTTKDLTLTSNTVSSLTASSTLSSQETSTASLWMLARILEIKTTSRTESVKNTEPDGVCEDTELYCDIALSRALAALTAASRNATHDWRSTSLALEVLTVIARYSGRKFRSTLVDTLYPIVESLGSSEPLLIEQSIRCLNSIAQDCAYVDASEMIVRNNDYLINAISLKLNTFDIDSRAPKILVMMLKLGGARLVPYMDDTLESIFAILSSYHGYPHLVRSFFHVLQAILEAAFESPSLLRLSVPGHRIMSTSKPTFSDIKIRLQQAEVLPNIDTVDTGIVGDKLLIEEDGKPGTGSDNNASVLSEEKQPLPKSYSIVESILRLCQYYLTSREAELRRQMLDLISTGCQSLCKHEERFLPVVNDLWPIVVQRLYDGESFVSQAAMKALSSFFAGAGNFLASRIEEEWTSLQSLYDRLKFDADVSTRGRLSSNDSTLPSRTFDGFVCMLVDLVSCVRLSSEIEDDIFAMLGKLAKTNRALEDALKCLNADALWLSNDLVNFKGRTPIVDGFIFQALGSPEKRL